MGVLNFGQKTLNEIFMIPLESRPFYTGIMTSLVPFGSIIGTLLTSLILQKLGRRKTLIFCDILGAFGWLLSVIYVDLTLFLFSRFIVGIITGINSNVVPIYIKECCPVDILGGVAQINPMLIAFGVMLSYILGLGHSSEPLPTDTYWIFCFLFPILFCLIRSYFLVTKYTLDTPCSYVLLENNEKCLEALDSIYKEEFIQEQFKIVV